MKKTIYILSSLLLASCSMGQHKKSTPKMIIKQYIDTFKTKLPSPPFITIKLDTNMNNVFTTQKPSHRLYMRSSHCQFEILVDDVPLNSFFGKITERGGGLGGDNLLNPIMLKTGKHKILLRMFPRYGQKQLEFHSHLEAEVYILDAADYQSRREIKLLKLEPPETHVNQPIPYPVEGLPYYEMHGEIDIKLPFSLEGWTNSVNLKQEEDNGYNLKAELQHMYDSIRTIIENKNLNAFKQLIQEREDLMSTAFFFNDKQKQDRWKQFQNMLMDGSFTVAPLPKEATLYFYGYGKMITLLDAHREGIIKLVNKNDPEDTVAFEFRFHRKKKGDKLTII